MSVRAKLRFSRLSIIQHLVILSLVVLLPQVLLGASVAWRYSKDQREALEQQAQNIARNRGATLDREIEGMIGALQALATSPLIVSGDFAGLREQAGQILRFRGSAVAMRDATGQQWVNTLLPIDQKLPRSVDPDLLAADRQIFETRLPAVSDLYIGAVAKRPFVMVGVPVIRDDKVLYVLNIGIEPIEWGRALLRDIPDGWTASIVDRKHKVITRSRDAERFIGQVGTESFRSRLTKDSGSFHGGHTLEGQPVFVAYQRSQLAGWYISFAIPENVMSEPLHDLRWMFIISGGTGLILSIAAAVLYGRIIGNGLGALARSARRVGQDDFVQVHHTTVAEMDDVGRILAQADAELKRKDQHQRTLLAELDHRVKNTLAIIQSLVTQSLRSAKSPEHFRDAITGRVMALARSHEVLSAANWESPQLVDVVRAVLGRETARMCYKGSAIRLSPRVVVAFAQIFQELLSNAESHGGLSEEVGLVSVIWSLDDQRRTLLLKWEESSISPRPSQGKEGLGSAIVRICVERQLGGSCRFTFLGTVMRFEAEIPLQSDLGVIATPVEKDLS